MFTRMVVDRAAGELRRETATALRQALIDIERLRSDEPWQYRSIVQYWLGKKLNTSERPSKAGSWQALDHAPGDANAGLPIWSARGQYSFSFVHRCARNGGNSVRLDVRRIAHLALLQQNLRPRVWFA
jgi:hypothetical protein